MKLNCFEYYKDKGVKNLCHLVKKNNYKAIQLIAKYLEKELPNQNLNLIPVPNSSGKAEYTLNLVNEIKKINSNYNLLDILESKPRMSLYYAKKKGINVDFS